MILKRHVLWARGSFARSLYVSCVFPAVSRVCGGLTGPCVLPCVLPPRADKARLALKGMAWTRRDDFRP